MKSRILGTTAMVAGTFLLSAGGAQGAEKIKLGLGGYWKGLAVAGSQSDGVGQPGANIRQHGFAQESEIHFSGETTLDNGIKVGVNVQLEAETSADQIDESYIYAEGPFGKMVFGQEDPASDAMAIGSPAPIQGVGLASPDFLHATLGNTPASPAVVSNISGDAEKLTYFTPRMQGIQLGLSYTPDGCAAPGCLTAAPALLSQITAGQQSEIIEGAINYVRQFNGGEIDLYAGFAQGDLEVAAAGAEDQDQWGVGFSLVYGDITFGADYRQDDQATSAASTDRTDYSVGVSYTMGDWNLGAAYAHAETEEGAGLGNDETDGYQIGANYTMGPGILLIGGMTFWDVEDNLNAVGVENDAQIFTFGTILNF